ncbi:CamS family sex pheromone protein [Aerococcus suis]|uniref:Protein involved in sex pheromone biosynthesis n=1 Tax=Aerococcus suis TaxID=371602 RepID=A0A1W1Z8B1_9LACT|nr:CamS family sex pheromone protein [Aerococcus suis]MDD7758557.1 CamS family sex pheromone protein [Aerococcus suis]MDY4646580.1 CamS family sex pheromone protein [Aerococcus suis]SMC44680.1 Protein involved in sex pheromone biosynthesis [Aerococcus suis]
MVKKTWQMLTITALTLSLAACQQFKELPDPNESSDKVSNESTQQLSDDYYQAVVEDNNYEVNQTSGLTVGPTSQANTENLEEGLYQLAQGAFPTDEYLLKEGTAISEETANNWLGTKNDDNPEGLNPDGYNASSRDKFEPRYLNSIIEYDLMQEQDDGSMKLGGISIALAMNESDTFTSDDDSEESVEIKRDTQKAKGQEMAKEIVSRLRKQDKYKDVPIQVGIFANAPSDDVGGGTFISEAMASEGKNLDDWTEYKTDYIVFGVDDAPNEEDSEAFQTFQSDVEDLFPQLSGITGVGRYEDGDLEHIDVTINSQFDGYTETVALTQRTMDSAENLFNKNIAVDIEIISPEGTRAVLSRPAGADTFTSTIS